MSLCDDYLAGADALRPFFRGFPKDAIESVPMAAGIEQELHTSIERHQERLGAPKEVPRQCAVVATGQQTGLFTGPLYTIYKAVTAIKLAAMLEQRHGVPCVPLFWCASEDHDFEECSTAWVLTRKDEPARFSYRPEADIHGRPMYRVPLAGKLHRQIEEIARVARLGSEAKYVSAMLSDTLAASDSLADWFARIMAWLFKDTPLVIFAPHWEAARIAAKPILARAIDRPLAVGDAVRTAGASLQAQGYGAQLDMAEGQAPFFLEVQGRRCAVERCRPGAPAGREDTEHDRRGRRSYIDAPGFAVHSANLRLTAAEMQTLLDDQPGRFSPNAALRPVVQQALFPVHAYVGGPGEIAYWAQLDEVFAQFGHPMPHVYPRTRAVISREKLHRWQSDYGFSHEDLRRPHQELELPALEALPPLEPLIALRESEPELREALRRFRASLEPYGGPAKSMAAAIAAENDAYLRHMNRVLLRMDGERRSTVRNRIARLQGALAPNRKPQERVYCVLSYLFEHSWELVPRLMDGLDIEDFGLQEILL